MKIPCTDPLFFKVVAPIEVGDLKFGVAEKVRGRRVVEIPFGLLCYLRRPKPSTKAELLSMEGLDYSEIYDNVGILEMLINEVPELAKVITGASGNKFRIANLMFNPELQPTPEEFIAGINYLVSEFNNSAKRIVYKGTKIFHVTENGKLIALNEPIELFTPALLAKEQKNVK
jgi:hypothetical protein